MLFLEHLDRIHRENIKESAIAKDNRDFKSIIPIQIEYDDRTFDFEIRKSKKSMLFLIVDRQRVYLSDADIIKTILEMTEHDAKWYLTQFIHLYTAKKRTINIMIDEECYPVQGIPMRREDKTIQLFTDSAIRMNYFSAMLSFVFAKDKCWAEIKDKDFYGNITLCKLISLIDYYKFRNPRSEGYLDSIGLDYCKKQFDPEMDTRIFKNENAIKMFDISQYK